MVMVVVIHIIIIVTVMINVIIIVNDRSKKPKLFVCLFVCCLLDVVGVLVE